MGAVVKFVGRDTFSSSVCHAEPAIVIFLPVVRIERNPDEPADGPGRHRRRRRSSRVLTCAGCSLPIDGSTCSDCGHVHGGLVLKER